MKEWFKKTKDKLFNGLKTVFNYVKKYSIISYKFAKKYLVVGFIFFKKHYLKIGFYFLAFIFFINAIFMSLHLMNRNYDYKILNKLYIEAILPDQDLTGKMFTGIVKIEEIDYDEITIDDKVVFCCDYGLDENWVQDIVDIDREEKQLETTYDGLVTTDVFEEEVYCVFIKEANFFGTMYYTSSFVRGYVLLMTSQILFIYFYHYVFIKKRLADLKKSKTTESEENNENS